MDLVPIQMPLNFERDLYHCLGTKIIISVFLFTYYYVLWWKFALSESSCLRLYKRFVFLLLMNISNCTKLEIVLLKNIKNMCLLLNMAVTSWKRYNFGII